MIKGSDFLLELQERARENHSIEVNDLVGRSGRLGTAFALLLLALPTVIPMPGPFGLVFGTCLVFVALQMLIGADRLWLPNFIGRRKLSVKVVDTMVRVGRPWVLKLERWLQTGRMPMLTGRTARMVLALPIFLLAVLIALPIPFGNTVPALAVIMIAIALAERDGLVIILSLFVAIAAGFVSYYLISAAGTAVQLAF